jgi:hypothetical protein
MNYTTITINDQKVGLKFGMASFRYLQDKLVEGKSYQGGDLNEIGIAHIIYSGYFNNCLVKDVEPSLKFEEFVDWIEFNLTNEDIMTQIKSVIEIWTNNQYIQGAVSENNQAKKKTSRGKK